MIFVSAFSVPAKRPRSSLSFSSMCLACNLTHGLPQVFRRHPVIALNALCADLAERAGWKDGEWTWELGSTEEVSNKLHVIPLTLKR